MRIAALDLGSNSFHLLVVEARPDGTFDALAREKEMLRLGDVVTRLGRIDDASADSALETVRRFARLADSVGAADIVALGTSALREADNSDALLDRIEEETGVHVELVSGSREARLIFGAVRSSVLIDPAPALAADLGGGSLELMVGDQSELAWSCSLKLGVARLTAELVTSDPPSAAECAALRDRTNRVLAPVAETVARYAPRMLIGSSGTLCTLARMASARRQGQVPESVNQLTVGLRDLEDVHEDVLSMPAVDRQRLPGLDANRVDLIPCGSVVLLALMEMFGFVELTVSEWALREGIVLDQIGAHDPSEWEGDPRALRLGAVQSLGRRCGWGEEHATQVARLATELFDQTLPLHRLGREDRELLEYGALLHDIGEHVSVEGHDRHSAYLILNGRLRGFAPDEIRVLACLGRFHRRGGLKSSFQPLAALDPDRRRRVARMVALLRVADALDRGHGAAVEGLEVELLQDRVRLYVRAKEDIEVELWGLRRKRELFEDVFSRSLEVVTV